MNYRNLGTSDVKVSEISFGCWTMGGLNWVNGNPNGWADVNEDEITAGIKRVRPTLQHLGPHNGNGALEVVGRVRLLPLEPHLAFLDQFVHRGRRVF